MDKRSVLSVFLCLGSLASCATVPGPMQEGAPETRADAAPRKTYLFQLGARSLSDKAWDQIDQHVLIGFEGAWLGEGSPFGFEYGLSLSGDSTTFMGVDVTGTLFEGFFGGRYVLGDGPLFPVAGVGLEFASAHVEGETGGMSVSDDDTAFGAYAHVGLLWRVAGSLLLGLDARVAETSNLTLFGVDGDASYTQLALVLGWGS